MNQRLMWVPEEFAEALDKAAHDRGVDPSTYVRRSLAVSLADDLHTGVREILRLVPGPEPYRWGHPHRAGPDDGSGIETWCPHPGCDGTHLVG